MQVCPAAPKMPATAPITAWSRSASSNTMLADFPPSSSVTFLKSLAAISLIFWPAASPPVKATLATRGWPTSGSPTSAPKPVMTLKTPGGKPANFTNAASSNNELDVYSEGLITIVLPAASAGAIFQTVRASGEFHGVIAATTPRGSCLT
ncbi:hypothetical protein FQZ97_921380 [compost metagenome]